jgi:L-asparaginase II
MGIHKVIHMESHMENENENSKYIKKGGMGENMKMTDTEYRDAYAQVAPVLKEMGLNENEIQALIELANGLRHNHGVVLGVTGDADKLKPNIVTF